MGVDPPTGILWATPPFHLACLLCVESCDVSCPFCHGLSSTAPPPGSLPGLLPSLSSHCHLLSNNDTPFQEHALNPGLHAGCQRHLSSDPGPATQDCGPAARRQALRQAAEPGPAPTPSPAWRQPCGLAHASPAHSPGPLRLGTRRSDTTRFKCSARGWHRRGHTR